ncbi:MAG: DUF4440 domain-containing protein [Longimicrobiales bacterium]
MSRRSPGALHAPSLAATLAAAFLLGAPSLSAQDHAGHAMSADSAAVAAVVQAYHDALAAADSAAALALLAEDAMILESGGVETRAEYRSHHLPGDMAFAAAVPRQRGPIRVTVEGGIAWAVSTSTTTGTYRDRDIDSRGAELMVLSREPDGWRIRAIHWSSRANR